MYIFDEVLEVLDQTTRNFIIEETILNRLNDRTVVIVTTEMELLRNSSYIYLMERGEILEHGNFEKMEKSPIVQKYLQKSQVSILICYHHWPPYLISIFKSYLFNNL